MGILGDLWDRATQSEAVAERHGVALETDRATWTTPHLDVLDDTLSRLPAEHVAPVDSFTLGGTRAWGEHLGHDIWLSSSTEALGEAVKHPGDTSALAGHDQPVRQLEMTVAHEVGHDVRLSHPEAYAKIMEAAGWRGGLGAADLASAGLLRDDLLAILGGDELASDGQRYLVDTDAMGEDARQRQARGETVSALPPQFLSYTEDFVPFGGAHSDDGEVDSWSYARSEPAEYFSELYTKAANLPELLHEDLVGDPARDVEVAALSVEAAREDLARARTGAERAAAQAALDDAEAQAARARTAAAHKQTQWDVMRGDVFGVTDELVEDRVMDLEALGSWNDPAEMDQILQAFRQDATRVATPDQLERLFAGHLEATSHREPEAHAPWA